MKIRKLKFILAVFVCGLATASMSVPNAHGQQPARADQVMSNPPPATAPNAPVEKIDRSQTIEHDKVRTSAQHIYNSPAERANDDLLITEVKSSLAERGISDRYPVEVDCDHGTILLSGVVASADDARTAESIALNTRGVVGVKDKLTWR